MNTKIRIAQSGLGFEATQLSMDLSEEQKVKKINWMKTKNRYNQINSQIKSSLTEAFYVESDDDET